MARIDAVWTIVNATENTKGHDGALEGRFITYVVLDDGDRFDLDAFATFADALEGLALGVPENLMTSSVVTGMGIRF